MAGECSSSIVIKNPKQNERILITANILLDALLEGKIGKTKMTKAVSSKHKVAA